MEEVAIYLTCPGLETVEVCTSPFSTVQSLEAFLPDCPPFSFYLGDFELCASFSLGYYGISNFCTITAIPAQQQVAPPPPMTALKCEPPTVADRLTDQFFQHIEGTTSSYRKLVSKFLRLGGSRSKKRQHRTTVIPPATQQPSTAELPQFW
jgi:hypothetical protein